MLKRILFVGSKGSSAKTTLTLSLAKLSAQTWPNYKLAVVDLDFGQKSSETFTSFVGLDLVDQAEADLTFVDSGAKLHGIQAEYEKADRIVLCSTAGPMDLPVNTGYAAKDLTPYSDKTRILFTRIKTVSKLDQQMVRREEPYNTIFSGFRVMTNYMRELQDYRNFILTGDLTSKIKNELTNIMLELVGD